MRQARVRAYRSGLLAETIAAFLLRLKGHRIVAQRYKTPVGEIDLVALKGKRLAFIEVKRRKTAEDAAWTLPAKQRRRIVRAAQYWLAGHPDFAGTTSPSTWYSRHPGPGRAISRTHFLFDGSGAPAIPL
jgi:putative endonuclease